MNGTIDRIGRIAIQWDLNQDKLYSPDGTQHCLPCENCGLPQWVSLNTVSVICDRCALALTESDICQCPDDGTGTHKTSLGVQRCNTCNKPL